MANKISLQDDELQNVTGGVTVAPGMVLCGKCRNQFRPLSADGSKMTFTDGCNKTTYYECPSCGVRWQAPD